MLFISAILENTSETATRIVGRIKDGDKQLKEKFIKDYIPFIIKNISSFYSIKVVDIKDRDEYSIGLMAFDEAIEKFDSSKNISFLNFAKMVIRRRMIDYFRYINKNNYEIPFSSFSAKNENELEEKLNMFTNDGETNRYDIIHELKEFSKELEAFGLDIKDLPYYMPKHKDSKYMCLSIAKSIMQNKSIYDKLMTKKYFPMKELTKITDVNPKTIERNREFIICICIIYGKNYESFKAHLNQIFL
ncbi:MAG: sigma factor [Bacillota bacterium]|nr:sigma factor [Bacillota bacterium]